LEINYWVRKQPQEKTSLLKLVPGVIDIGEKKRVFMEPLLVAKRNLTEVLMEVRFSKIPSDY
jgi:hypothetical protein